MPLRIYRYTLLLFLFGILISCSKTETVNPEDSFVRIYDNSEFGGSFFPVDVKQTEDGGYLILAEVKLTETNFYGVYLLKVDKQGNFLWENKSTATYVNPIPGLFKINTDYYFFCMDRFSLNTYLMRVNDGFEPTVERTFALQYPLAVSQTSDNGFLLQTYNRLTLNSQLSKISSAFAVSWTGNYPVLEDAEEKLIEHLTKSGQKLPFLTGEGNGGYFLNGFSNYTFAMVFTNTTNGANTGVVNGFRYDGAVSSAVALTGGKYALSRFNFGENFILPQTTVSTSGITSATNLTGKAVTELVNNANVIAKKITSGTKEVVLFASSTKGNQIVVYAYDATSGTLLGTKYLGYTNPYEIAGFTTTADGGIAILGTNYIGAGRFPRICLFKLSKAELTEITG